MIKRLNLVTTLYQEIRQDLEAKMSNIKKDLKTDFKVKAKCLSDEKQKGIIEEMRESYFEPYRTDTFFPKLKKLSKTNFSNYTEHCFYEGLYKCFNDPGSKTSTEPSYYFLILQNKTCFN